MFWSIGVKIINTCIVYAKANEINEVDKIDLIYHQNLNNEIALA